MLLDTGNNWFAGNYKNGEGDYSVKEAYLEFDLPVFDTEGAGRANLNAAYRMTDYSTSGSIDVWKVGSTWDTPLDGLRLRATTSRDARAPNLSELFAAPVTTTLPNFLDPFRNINVLAIQNVVGNPNLTPEIARNTSFGVVLAEPSWLPNFSISVDYYKIKIDDVISTLTANDIVNFCFRNVLPRLAARSISTIRTGRISSTCSRSTSPRSRPTVTTSKRAIAGRSCSVCPGPSPCAHWPRTSVNMSLTTACRALFPPTPRARIPAIHRTGKSWPSRATTPTNIRS